MVARIPVKRFEEFHKCFKGDTYQACTVCGGKCEYSKIGTLLPGEKEYIAKSLGIFVPEFENMYLDRLVTPLGSVDVLKLVYGCPFLDDQFTCTIKNDKVTLCEIYPIVFSVNDDSITFQLDEKCPLTKDEKVCKYFLETGVKCFKLLKVPIGWFKITVLYDDLNFDYKKIEKLRKSRQTYESFNLSDIMKFEIK